MRNVLVSSMLVLSLFGCAVGPNYQRPSVESPPSWRFEEKEAREVANTVWWDQFDDPVLNELIQTALQENKDLKIAAARIEEFIGRYVTTRAALFPQVSTGDSVGKNRVTQKSSTPYPSTGENPAYNLQASLNASWEIDLWGKLRRATEASRADLLSTEEGRRAVILSLVTSVANAYVNLRDLDKELEIAERTAHSREESYDLFKTRYRVGVISETELYQAKSEYEQALATIPFLEKTIAQQENALSVLLGRNPGAIPRGKTIDEFVLPAVPAGLPSDLLTNRPDIRQAEQDLIAANARIGVARAQYYPTISLTALFGYASTDLSNLFMGPAKIWSFAVPLTAPIFTGGAIKGRVKSAEAVQQEALLHYQQSIQNSFREVEDALIDQRKSREQLEVENLQVDSLRNYARLARLQYDNGRTSYIEVLDAERSLFVAELSRAQTKGVLFNSLVNLYKAMGGGWVLEADRLTDAATDSKISRHEDEVLHANQ
ncbi:MAG TPA: efflux transporter outer membrane subunit [Syntrophorhabdales bacterium]|nr:efflux transporter outer membrane subunit [Syntrophorhabdales bacterium]